MQPLDPAGNYSDLEVLDQLTARYGTRHLSFRYDRLDSSNNLIEPLVGVVASASVANDSLAELKRTARFSILDRTAVNFLRDRIKPWARLRMDDGGWVEWPLGVFLLSTPSRDLDDAGIVARDVEAYDQLVVLRDDKVVTRYSVASGTVYTTAIATLVGTVGGIVAAITPSALTTSAVLEWEPGTPKLEILNDLLAAINYGSAWFDEQGTLICRPYQTPADRSSEYTYADDDMSVRHMPAQQTIDLFDVPNRIVLVLSEPDQIPLTSTYTNASPSSPTSTVSRGRTIVDVRTVSDAASQATLDELAKRAAFDASQVFEVLTFTTAIMPMHSDSDVLTLGVPRLAIDGKYSETSWSFELTAGASMSHSVRRVVTV